MSGIKTSVATLPPYFNSSNPPVTQDLGQSQSTSASGIPGEDRIATLEHRISVLVAQAKAQSSSMVSDPPIYNGYNNFKEWAYKMRNKLEMMGDLNDRKKLTYVVSRIGGRAFRKISDELPNNGATS
ncbi:hypothetical protein PMZ80_004633 [Knufia obscura]|uniref:Uncharacterized protein n=2 Tax=Knufia TaxID=430999 RepID=A0AAN8I809_9EURO|nr:hypothetical protein PMZ80_004633 [Knufia obscura]KAK5952625.1 hypothetical protein OHC33_006217 [Knufia fluminis]